MLLADKRDPAMLGSCVAAFAFLFAHPPRASAPGVHEEQLPSLQTIEIKNIQLRVGCLPRVFRAGVPFPPLVHRGAKFEAEDVEIDNLAGVGAPPTMQDCTDTVHAGQ